MEYAWLIELIHIISAGVIFGSGIASAFYLFSANRQADINNIYFVARLVVIANWLVTTPALAIQLITGLTLIYLEGFSFLEPWIFLALLLYCFVVFCWLPVIWIQIKMRDTTKLSLAKLTQDKLTSSMGASLPEAYWRLNFWCIVLGSLALSAILAIFYIMKVKPDLGA